MAGVGTVKTVRHKLFLSIKASCIGNKLCHVIVHFGLGYTVLYVKYGCMVEKV